MTASTAMGAPLTHSSGHARTITSAGWDISLTCCTTRLRPTWVNGHVMSAYTSTICMPSVSPGADEDRAPDRPCRSGRERRSVELRDQAGVSAVLDEQVAGLRHDVVVSAVGHLPVVERIHVGFGIETGELRDVVV